MARERRSVGASGVGHGVSASRSSAKSSGIQVIVLGMHRSGTSALTGALARMGLFVGEEDDLTSPSWENPDGFYERKDFRTICDALLQRAGADWWKVSAFDPDYLDHALVRAQRREIAKAVKNLDQAGSSWALKEPRLCLLLPLFRAAITRPVILMIYRHPVEVAHSLRRRNGFSLRAGLALWEAYNVRALHHSRSLNPIIVGYEELTDDPYLTLSKVARALEDRGGDKLDVVAAVAGINPDLRRERLAVDEGVELLTAAQKRLWDFLRADAKGDPPELSQDAIKELKSFEVDYGQQLAVREELSAARLALVELGGEVDNARRKSESDRQAARSLSEAREDLARRLAAADAALASVKESRDLAEDGLRRVNNELAVRAEQLDQLKARLAEAEIRLAAQGGQLSGAKRESELEKALADTLRAELARALARVEELEGQIGQLTQRRDDLSDGLLTKQIEVENLSRRVEALEQEVQNSAERARSLEASLREAGDRDKESTLRIEQLERQEFELKTLLTVAKADAERLISEDRVGRDEIERLRSELNARENALALTMDSERRAREDATRLSESEAAARASVAAAQTDLSLALQQVHLLSEAERLARDEAGRLAEAELIVRERVASLQTDLAQAQEQLRVLAESERRAGEDRVRLTQADIAGRRRIDELQAELAQTRDQLELREGALSAQLERARSENEELAKRLYDAETELAQSRQQLEARVSTLSAQLDHSRREKEGLADRLSDVGAEMESLGLRLAGAENSRAAAMRVAEELKANLGRRDQNISELRRETDLVIQSERRKEQEIGRLTALAEEREVELQAVRTNVQQLERRLADAESQRRVVLAETKALGRDLHNLRQSRAVRSIEVVRRLLRPGDARRSERNAALDFETRVARVRETVLFDRGWYLSENPDVLQSGIDPVEHYLRSGADEGRNPHPMFDQTFYLSQFTDPGEVAPTPVEHYLNSGFQTDQLPSSLIDLKSIFAENNPHDIPGETALEKYINLREKIDKLDRSSIPATANNFIDTPSIHTNIERLELQPKFPQVAVIVCVHNAPDDTKACLESIIANRTLDHDLIIVNDGSAPETTTLVQSFARQYDFIEVISNQPARGYTRAANQGLRASDAPFAVLLNSDTIVSPEWLERMLTCILHDPMTAVVGPLSNAASWQSIPELRDQNGKWKVNGIPEGSTLAGYAASIAAKREPIWPNVSLINGFCYMIRRAALDKVGLLDEKTFPTGYGEEDDLSLRLLAAGHRCRVADDVYVYHAKSKSFTPERRSSIVETAKGKLAAKHGQAAIDLALAETAQCENLLRARVHSSLLAEHHSRTPPTRDLRRMRVAWYQPHLKMAGAIRRTVEMTNRLHAWNCCVELVTPDGVAPDWISADAPVIALKSALERAYDLVIYNDPDVVDDALRLNAPKWVNYHLAAYMVYRPHNAALETYYAGGGKPTIHVANSTWTAEKAREFSGIEMGGVFPGGISKEQFYPRRNEIEFDVGFFGSLRRQHKGTFDILRATTGLRRMSMNEINAPQDQLASWISKCRVFASAAWHEGFNFCPLEAMACGVPVAMTQDGGSSEYARDEWNALIVPPKDPQALQQAIHRVTLDRELRLKLIENGMKTAWRYDWDDVTADFADLLLNNYEVQRH